MLRKAYLTVYNTVQLILWSIVLFQLLRVSISTAYQIIYQSIPFSLPQFASAAYKRTSPYADIAQTLAWAEVIHACLGIAGGGVSTAFIQSLGRYVVLIYVIKPIPIAHRLVVTPLLLFSWACGDIIRYAFYLWTPPPRFLLWLRYSMFLVLYPVGISSEWFIYLYTLGEVDRRNLYAITMPNNFNFAFDFGVWNRVVLGLYFVFGPYMCTHMLHQRRRKLKIRTD